MAERTVWIGYDPREDIAYRVAYKSLLRFGSPPVNPIHLSQLQARGEYERPTERIGGRLWDHISMAPMSTEFALSRFWVPALARTGWALFMDCDVLIRHPIADLFALADPQYAVMVVKHPTPVSGRHASGLKMDGQEQASYRCKNWSSVMLINCDHPSNRRLTHDLLNTAPGRDLHQFCWLDPSEIGALPRQWNHLVGIDRPDPCTKIAHFTLGIPTMLGCADCEFADQWRLFV